MTEDETSFFFLKSVFCFFVFSTLIPLFLTAPSGSILYFSLPTHIHTNCECGQWQAVHLWSPLCVCLLWSEPSKFPFIRSCVTDFSPWHTVILSLAFCNTHTHTHSNANKNSSISKTPSHFDLQHLRPFTITQDRVYRAMPKSETFEFLPTVGWDIKGVKLYLFN